MSKYANAKKLSWLSETRIQSICKNQIAFFLLLQAIVSIFVIFVFDGTGDSGDSVMHYLFAKYSYQHHELFFHHWAKPLYVLLASPFAQFGFIGVKVFNAMVMMVTVLFTYKTIQQLQLKNPIAGALFLIGAPLVFVLTFSGLTEPLFALFLIAGIYLLLVERRIVSCILISFLPFIRSEGLIIIGVIGFYLLLERKWKLLPLLLTGHVVYSIAGYPFYKDFLWVFNKIPYAVLSSQYTNLYSKDGRLFHFVEQMNYVVGVPIYFLFWLGIVSMIHHSIKKKISREVTVLILLGFFSFFIAHTLFWYFGIFNSMGLKRVLISVAPLSAIISLMGFNYILQISSLKKLGTIIVKVVVIICVLVFPFTSNPAAINWKKDMMLTTEQELANQVTSFIKEHQLSNHRFVHLYPYLNETLNIDHFNNERRIDLDKASFPQIKSGDIIVWENWFAVVDGGITQEIMESQQQLKKLYTISGNDKGREVVFTIYECK